MSESRHELRLSGISIAFPAATGGWRRVVDDVSLSIAEGEAVGLVGESGSGKSLFALAALGLVPEPGRQVAGAVTFDGVDLHAASSDRLRSIRGGEIGLVFQEPSTALNPVFSVGHQLVETVLCHRPVGRAQAKEAARRLLEDVSLDSSRQTLRAYPHELSGGQRQRVMIALALAGDPRFLIADEPTTALDLTIQGQILDLLHRVREERGLGLLLISHDLAVVASVVSRVVVMYAGEVVEESPTGLLFERPLHPYTRLLLASLDGRPPAAPSTPPADVPGRAHRAAEDGCRFAPRCAQAVAKCRSIHPLLEDAGGGRSLRCPVALAAAGATDSGGPA